MKNLILVSIFVSLSFINASRLLSDTTFVSGLIVSQNWNTAGSPYVVTGDILVAGLSIDPGVSVLFAGNYEFEVQGVIEAVGDSLQPILFSVKSGVSSWKGIRFQNSNPGSIMKWCIIEKANNSGVRIIESLPIFVHCTFRNNTVTYYGGGMVVSNSVVIGKIVVSKCNFTNNLATNYNGDAYGGGILINSGSTVDLESCEFLKNSVYAERNNSVGAYGGAIMTAGITTISNCRLTENKVYSYNYSCCSGISYAFGAAISSSGTTIIKNSVIAYDTATATGRLPSAKGAFYSNAGITRIDNCSIIRNNIHGLYRESSSSLRVVNSIVFFNNNNGQQTVGIDTVYYCDIQGSIFPGPGNINFAPILDPNLKVVAGSLCIDAGNDSTIYNDGCRPPALGGVRNDMGAHGGPGNCEWLHRTIKVKLSAAMEGLFNPVTNLMSRQQVQRLFLRSTTPPYNLSEAAAGTLATNGISNDFVFNYAPTNTYYLVAKNFNCIETWSKSGGESLVRNNSVYNYDFTSAASKAYGSNMILKGSKWCIYSGDVDQGTSIDGTDLAYVDNDAFNSSFGYLSTDVNGDNFIDGTDASIIDNNVARFVSVMRP